MNFFIKINYEDLLTSVKFQVAGSAIAFSRLSYRTFFRGMTLLNAISLQTFQNKMKISPPVLQASPAEHLRIYKKVRFNTVTTIHYNKSGIRRHETDLE